jgi:chromosome partitioning protein
MTPGIVFHVKRRPWKFAWRTALTDAPEVTKIQQVHSPRPQLASNMAGSDSAGGARGSGGVLAAEECGPLSSDITAPGQGGMAGGTLPAQPHGGFSAAADPLPGPRDPYPGVAPGSDPDAVSRETETEPELVDDTPIARAARQAVETMGRAAEGLPLPAETRVMVVANQKGGVGKTTSTVNLAAALALHGARVLVVDLDPQGNASTALGIDHHASVPSIYDVLVEGKDLAEVVQPVVDVEGLFCAPATIDLAGAEIELVSLVARESRLQRAIDSYEQPLDYILIDCPPSLGLLTVNALVAGREVVIPIQCEYYALEGLGQLLRNVELVRGHLNPQLHVSTILLTMYDARTRLASQVAQEVRDHFAAEVLNTSIPRSVRISEAPSYGQTVMTYDPGSSGALSYLEAAREISVRGIAAETKGAQ